MAEIEINGKKITADQGTMIIEAADKHGIWIPRFCYHPKLSIAANCRMCLVDVEKSNKPVPACATPVSDGMKVWTQSPNALLAQKAVMEFLLINHPLDCPICDQGGECELQDISIGYGYDYSEFTERKRSVKDKDIGPLVQTDMTRCIQCTRCVRFGSELAGVRELGATGRGEHMEIGTFVERTVDSEVSGNIIDICPVGALTSKPYRFKARAWELKQSPSIAPHDCLGSHIFIHQLRNKVLRVVPKENEDINEVWLSDRDRFSYEAVYEDRLTQPKMKVGDKFITVSWTEALDAIVNTLSEAQNKDGFSKENLYALASPNLTTEEFYLIQKLLRNLGSNNIDHRLRETDFKHQDSAPSFPHLGMSLSELEKQNSVLLVGSLIRSEQPLLGIKFRNMALADCKIMAINPCDADFNFEITHNNVVEAADFINGLASFAKAIMNEKNQKIPEGVNVEGANEWLKDIIPTEFDIQMAKTFCQNEKKAIILGALAHSHPESSSIVTLCHLISQLTGASFGSLTEGSNAAGAWLAGCVPHRLPGGKSLEKPGLNITEFLKETKNQNKNQDNGQDNENPEKFQKAVFLFGIEPDLDCIEGLKLMKALKKSQFVVATTCYESKILEEVAQVLLPMVPFTENTGTLVNVEGRFQGFKAAVSPLGEARPLWKILRVLGNLLDLPGFEYNTAKEILQELQTIIGEPSREDWIWQNPKNLKLKLNDSKDSKDELIRLAPVSIYAGDSTVRRAPSLQKTRAATKIAAKLNPKWAEKHQLKENQTYQFEANGETIELPVCFDKTVPENTVIIPTALRETVYLGGSYQPIKIVI